MIMLQSQNSQIYQTEQFYGNSTCKISLTQSIVQSFCVSQENSRYLQIRSKINPTPLQREYRRFEQVYFLIACFPISIRCEYQLTSSMIQPYPNFPARNFFSSLSHKCAHQSSLVCRTIVGKFLNLSNYLFGSKIVLSFPEKALSVILDHS